MFDALSDMWGKTCTLREASACDEAHERQRTPNCVLYTESIMPSVRVSRRIHKQTGQVRQWHCFSFSSIQDQSARELNGKKQGSDKVVSLRKTLYTQTFAAGSGCWHDRCFETSDMVPSQVKAFTQKESSYDHCRAPPHASFLESLGYWHP